MKKKPVSTLIGVAAIVAAHSSAFAVTVTNGSFEQGLTAANGGGSCAQGWTCTGDVNVQTWNFFNTQFGHTANLTASPNGGNVADAWYVTESSTPDTLSQTLTSLVVGQTYNLTFQEAITNRGSTLYNGTMDWVVSVGGKTISDHLLSIPGADASTPWTTVSANFVATAASETLQFLAHSSVPTAPEPVLLLDGVSVTAAVPEPGTYALMLGGLGVVGFIAKRRKAA